MKTSSTRAVAEFLILQWLAGIVAVAFGYHQYQTLVAPGRNKAKADQAAVSAAATSQQAAAVNATAGEVNAAVGQVVAAHAEAIKARDTIDSGVAGRIETAKAILATDANPSPAVAAAQIVLQDAQDALGRPLTDQERAYWTKLAVPLIQKQQDALAEAQHQREEAAKAIAARDAVQAESTRKDGLLSVATTTIKQQAGELVASATKTAQLTGENKQWADREPDVLARFKALGILIVMLVLGIAAYEIHRRGLVGALQDAVALKEHVETAAAAAGADTAKLKQAVEGWWADDPKARTVFDSIKAKLRL